MKSNVKFTQQGLTITEMLVGLFLASIVTLFVFTLFVENTRSTRFTNEISNVHKNIRLTQLLLNRELLNANNLGCKTGTYDSVNNIAIAPGSLARAPKYDFKSSFSARNGDNTGAGQPDSFEFSKIAEGDIYLKQSLGATYDDIYVNKVTLSDGSSLNTTNAVLITNCDYADIFMLSKVDANLNKLEHKTGTGSLNTNAYTDTSCITGQNEHCLSTTYEAGSKIHQINKHKFCLGSDASCNVAAKLAAGKTVDPEILYYIKNDGEASEWVKGIEDLQLQYGLDTDNDDFADTYVDDPSANEDKIKSVKVYALFASETGGLLEPDANGKYESFTYADRPTIEPTDGKYRYLLESVIQLRNRVGGQL